MLNDNSKHPKMLIAVFIFRSNPCEPKSKHGVVCRICCGNTCKDRIPQMRGRKPIVRNQKYIILKQQKTNLDKTNVHDVWMWTSPSQKNLKKSKKNTSFFSKFHLSGQKGGLCLSPTPGLWHLQQVSTGSIAIRPAGNKGSLDSTPPSLLLNTHMSNGNKTVTRHSITLIRL